MTNPYSPQLSNLSSEDRDLLDLLLEEEGIETAAVPTISPRDPAVPPPASFTQQRMWFIHQLAPNSAAYNISTAVRFKGDIDAEVLQRSLNEIVRRHETLRTTFRDEGSLIQFVAPTLSLKVSVIDLRHLPESEREAEAKLLANIESRKPFNLATGPLIRMTLWQIAAKDYVALLTLHHVISDAWSLPILVQELSTLYPAFAQGKPSPLPDLPIQFADFASWQRNWLQGEVLNTQLDYWKKRLAGAPAVLPLPTDRPRPPMQTYQGATDLFELPLGLSRSLRAISQKNEATLAMTLLASFFALLQRYTGQNDIIVSNGIANRNQSAIEGLIGPFVNILLMRADLSGNITFLDLLKQIRQISIEAFDHQDLPFEKLVEVLQPERDPSYSPLSQVMFVLHNRPETTVDLPGLALSMMSLENSIAQYDLLLRVDDNGGALHGRFEFNTDLFDASTIHRLSQNWQRLLTGIVVNPAQPLWQLPLMSATEQHHTLEDWNNTRAAYPDTQCLHQLFEAQVAQSPEAIATIFQGQPTSYAELNKRANQLAHHLQSLGIKPNSRVGLCVERSLDMVVGLMGIAKSGGAYVPLDARYPQERLAFMLADADISVLVTQKQLLPNLPAGNAAVVCLDADWDTIAKNSVSNPTSAVTPNDLVYVIYTSGSTGKPKGVMLNHRGRVNNFTDFNRRFDVKQDDRIIALASLSFDMCAYDVFGTLAAGAAIVLPIADQERDPMAWAKLIAEHQVTIWHTVPTMLELLVETVQEKPELHPRSIRLVLLGGDWIPVSLPDRIKAMAAGVRVISLGGATEASMDSTIYNIEGTDLGWRSIPYGVPMANQLAYVLDEHLQPVPTGVSGELFLGGLGLAWGYLNRPDLTAEKFVPHPFGNDPGARLYHTGDLARYYPDGNLELLGRIDYQVKIRGFRIDLGEIVATLRQHPAVHDAVVVSRAYTPGELVLVGYIIPTSNAIPDSNELRSYLKEKLPEYMVPVAITILDAFPITPNGKLDRKALPAPDFASTTTQSEMTPPETPLEEELLKAWSEVLGVEQFGVTDSFFDLGGDSFKAIRLIRKLDERIGLLELFKHPTIRQLAARMAVSRPSNNDLLQALKQSPTTPAISLVCAPYDGGNPVIYHSLSKALPDTYALYSVALPGHDYDKQLDDLKTIEEIAVLCIEEIKQKITGPIAVYGHSGGVALTVELARRLEAAGTKVECVFLAGALPGTKISQVKDILGAKIAQNRAPISDEKLLNYLQSLGAYGNFTDPAELKLVLKCARHDGKLSAEYFQKVVGMGKPVKLKVPIVCIVADKDPLTPDYHTRYREWQAFSNQVTLAVVQDRDHFFVKGRARDVADIITTELRKLKGI